MQQFPKRGTSSTAGQEEIKISSKDTASREKHRKRPAIHAPRWLWLIAVLFLVAGIVTSVVIFSERLIDFKQYGYLGAFLVSILASATVIAFIPSVPVIFALGGVLNPFLVGLVAGVGEAMGEFTAYFAGRSGHAFLFSRAKPAQASEPKGMYAWIQRWVKTRGGLALFLSAAVFNPFFSVIGATAGALRFPPWKFFLIVWAGKTVKWTVVALIGWGTLSVILRWFGINV
jgi:membrane protein DedA with SNARE-associated domain